MSNQTRTIVVGSGRVSGVPTSGAPQTPLIATSCAEVRRMLTPGAKYLVKVTESRLPDGDWCDVLRAIALTRIPADVEVYDEEGAPSFRFSVNGDDVFFVRASDPITALAAPQQWQASLRERR